MVTKYAGKLSAGGCALLAGPASLAALAVCGLAAAAQQTPGLPQGPAPGTSSYQGSVTQGEATAGTLDLSLDDAIQRGLRANLGIILSDTQTAEARGERLSELQPLLPSVNASAMETVTQVDLPAEGLRLPSFPKIIGPFSYTDVRASLSWSLVDVTSLRNYLAARHNFAAAQLSAQDVRDLVVLTVGNAYLLVLADEAQVASVEAQVATAKISLGQAQARHQAGTAPLLDELRAQVDYQTLEQQLIVARELTGKGQAGVGPGHRAAAGAATSS